MDDGNRLPMVAKWKVETQAELAKILKRLEPLQEQKKALEYRLEALDILLRDNYDNRASQTVMVKTSSLADAAYNVMKDLGVPTHYVRLYDLLIERGISIKGGKPRKNLVAHLSRDPRIERTNSRGVYRLVEWLNGAQEETPYDYEMPSDDDVPPPNEEVVVDDYNPWKDE